MVVRLKTRCKTAQPSHGFITEKRKAKRKTPENDNPFDDISFWLSIATIDFGFSEKETECDPVKQQAAKSHRL